MLEDHQLDLLVEEALGWFEPGYPADLVRDVRDRLKKEIGWIGRFEKDGKWEQWIEFAGRRPGDLEDHVWIVFCRLDLSHSGAWTDRDYHPL